VVPLNNNTSVERQVLDFSLVKNNKTYYYELEFVYNDIFLFSKLFYTHFFLIFVLLAILLFGVMVSSIALCTKSQEVTLF
jgi:NADH:ubiquinone oxidoreductase subunit 6 (subunit J)